MSFIPGNLVSDSKENRVDDEDEDDFTDETPLNNIIIIDWRFIEGISQKNKDSPNNNKYLLPGCITFLP